jgi:CheY-like chemotaxis protein
MKEKILLVDDEPNVLAGYKRQLRKQFVLDTAESGRAAIDLLGRNGPFAVVISDMQMPEMNGIQLLSEVRSQSPDSVRMMLTGNADLQTCVDAVNEGSIYRFLTKPCPPEQLAAAIQAGLDQYRLVTAERQIMGGTVRGVLRTLSDILSIINPGAFSRGARIRRYVRHIAAQLNAPYFWDYEMAAALSHIGCVALPPEVLARLQSGRSLNSQQMGVLANHPAVGCQLLAEIPRLERVAQIIGKQNSPTKRRILPSPQMTEEDAVDFGAQLLRVSLDLDRYLARNVPFIQALAELHKDYGPDHPMVEALMSFESEHADTVTMQISASELGDSMVAADDIQTNAGSVVVPKGQHITEPIRLHLQACAQTGGLKEPFAVEVVTAER